MLLHTPKIIVATIKISNDKCKLAFSFAFTIKFIGIVRFCDRFAFQRWKLRQDKKNIHKEVFWFVYLWGKVSKNTMSFNLKIQSTFEYRAICSICLCTTTDMCLWFFLLLCCECVCHIIFSTGNRICKYFSWWQS